MSDRIIHDQTLDPNEFGRKRLVTPVEERIDHVASWEYAKAQGSWALAEAAYEALLTEHSAREDLRELADALLGCIVRAPDGYLYLVGGEDETARLRAALSKETPCQ